jgi:hypothetical protein
LVCNRDENNKEFVGEARCPRTRSEEFRRCGPQEEEHFDFCAGCA